MQDGARPHTVYDNLAILYEHFGHRVLSDRYTRHFNCGHDWPPYSPDLTPCDFFLWGHLKGRVFKDRPLTLDALKAAITGEVNLITPQTLRKTMNNFRTRLQKVVQENGGHVEHLL